MKITLKRLFSVMLMLCLVVSMLPANLFAASAAEVDGNISFDTGTVLIPFEKIWEDDNNAGNYRPESITVRLYKDGVEVEAKTITAADGWKCQFDVSNNILRADNTVADFTIKEDSVPKYEEVAREDPNVTFTPPASGEWDPYTSCSSLKVPVTNNQGVDTIQQTVAIVKKGNTYLVWSVSPLSQAERAIIVNASTYGISFDNTTFISGLPGEYDGIVFTQTEVSFPAKSDWAQLESGTYIKSTSGANGGSITNKLIPQTTTISGTKTWVDAGNQDGLRPESITVNLMNGDKVAYTQTVTAATNWSFTFENVARFDENNNLITYTLTEDAVAGYTTVITGNQADGFAITNTHVPAVVSKIVTKVWDDNYNQDGLRPGSISVQLYADGAAKGDPVELNADNGWTYTWNNLPEMAAGKGIKYTVDETKVPDGYTKTIEGLTITNAHAPEQTAVSVTKVWDDADDQDGLRPDSITVALMNGETLVDTATLNEDNKWSHTFENLDKKANGAVINYTVVESGVPAGYTSATTGTKETGFTITNTHTPEETSVTVTKIWDDADNQDGKRSESITVELLADGESTGKTATLSGNGNEWTYTWTELAKYDQGVEIEYTVEELTEIDGYETTYSEDTLTITNKHTPETIEITGTKTWDDADDQDGIRPDSITVQVKDGDSVVASQTVTAEDEWKYSFSDLPKYANGQEITYTVVEVEVDGYETTVDGYDITNTHTPDVTDITVTKVWEDEDNLAGFRPENVTIVLLADGKEVETKDLSEDNDWTWTFENLPANAAGKDIAYTVKELEVENYDVEITGTEEDGYTITNTHEVERIEITVTKEWEDDSDRDGIRPDEIKLTLLANGESVGEPVSVTGEDNTWTYTFENLPKYANGEEIDYTVEEVEVPEEYTSVVEAFTITNTYEPELTEVTVTKTWEDADDQDGIRPESITVNLLANGTKVDSVKLDEKNDWTYTFENLFVNSEGEAITYTVEEIEVEGYETVIEGFDITNTHEVEKTEVSVTKVWDDADDQDGKRPESITVKLLADKEVVDEVVLSEENDWTHTFTDLDVNAAGEEIKYTVEEVEIEEYESKISGNAEEGYTITNVHEPETIEITVTKIWDDADNQDGIRPEKITVNLLANGEIVVSAELKATLRTIFTGDWTATFKDMPKYENGEEIEYTITENAVSGYETEITGSVEEGFTVTNTHEPEMTKLDVQKFWKDENNKYETRTEKVKITLYANGKSTGKTVTLNAKNQWFDSFENLPKFENGKEIKYTVKEASLALYKASYHYTGTKVVVTNTLSEVPNTGDTSNVGLYLGLMGVCAVAAVALILLNKKKRNA